MSFGNDWFNRNAANLAAVLIAVGVFLAILTSALTAVCGGVLTLPPDETCAQCVRGWLGAASGWAAAIGALVAALLTLPHLRKQTAFIWGDAPPTLDVTEHLDEDDYLVVRIVNWNRRTLFIEDIIVTTASSNENYADRVAFWEIKDNNGDRAGGFPIHLDGWEDRNSRPRFLRLDLVLLRDEEGEDVGITTDRTIPFPRDAVVTAKAKLLGDVHRKIELHAEAYPRA